MPKNKLDIHDEVEIHEVENELIVQAYIALSSQLTQSTVLNEEYFIDLHRKTFESLYEFAGVYRDVNMSKGDSQFCLAQYLHSESKRIFEELASEHYLRDIRVDKEMFAQRLAYFQCELIALHPFYELNGRITRLYCDMLALYNDYKPINYGDAIENNAYIDASVACVQYADSTLMTDIILKGLSNVCDA